MGSAAEFYVYAYLRADTSKHGATGTPYYIGKGHGRRAFKMHDAIPMPKLRTNIVVLASRMNEPDAHQLEVLLIHLYGRIDLGTGCLRNLTDGGEGVHGRVASDGERAAISKRGRALWASLTQEQRCKWRDAIRLGWERRTQEQDREYRGRVSRHRLEWHAGLTVDERCAWRQSLKRGWESLTGHEREKWREALKSGHARRSDQQRRELSERTSAANRARWARLTAEQRRKHSEAQRAGWAKRTQDQERKYADARKRLYASRTEAEKEEFRRRVSRASRRSWASCTDERRRERGRATSRAKKAWYASRTDDERRAFSESIKAWHIHLSDAQRARRSENLSQVAQRQWANYTKAEKQSWLQARKCGWESLSDDQKQLWRDRVGNAHRAQIAALDEDQRQKRNNQLHESLLARWARTPKKTHCPHGHPFDEANTYVDPQGRRHCKACRKMSKKRSRHPRIVPLQVNWTPTAHPDQSLVAPSPPPLVTASPTARVAVGRTAAPSAVPE